MNTAATLPYPNDLSASIIAADDAARALDRLFDATTAKPLILAMSSDCCGCNNYDER